MTREGPVTAAAKRVSPTVPIVMWGVTDPVGIGVISTLARPGGNVTGLSDDPDPETVGKRLQILKQIVPGLAKVAVLTRVPPSAVVPRVRRYEEAQEAGAKALGLVVKQWPLENVTDIDNAFVALVRDGFRALDVPYVPVTWTHRRLIMELATRYRLPAIYAQRAYVVDGGLVSYGEDEGEVPRRLAAYLDKILRGAKPEDLPVEQPTKLALVINLKTAKALGLTFPISLLQRADQVIE